VERVLADVDRLNAGAEDRRRYSLPFAGRWAEDRRRVRLLPLVWDLIKQGRLDDGLEFIARHGDHLQQDNEYAKLLALTGYELLERGQVERAVEQYRAAIAVDPTTTVAHLNLAAALVRLRQYSAAIEQYHEALRFDPRDTRIHYSLAWLLATAPDAAVRDGAEAVRWAELAAQQTQNRHTLVLETLAAALAEAQRYPEAVAMAQRVLERARAANDQEVIQRTELRLRLFQQNQPYHEPP
jgi:tetratricopeptide (TPR) repeat protein